MGQLCCHQYIANFNQPDHEMAILDMQFILFVQDTLLYRYTYRYIMEIIIIFHEVSSLLALAIAILFVCNS